MENEANSTRPGAVPITLVCDVKDAIATRMHSRNRVQVTPEGRAALRGGFFYASIRAVMYILGRR